MRWVIFFVSFVLAGCADRFLDRRENDVLKLERIQPTSKLLDQSSFAANLSRAYLAAGKDTARSQDLASGIIVLSAASVAVGALGSASDQALQNRALLGVGTQTVASRSVPKGAVDALYAGSKRMNCIATVARIGNAFLPGDANRTAARAATYGAIVEVQLITREGLVRDVPSYTTLLSDFTTGLNVERSGPEAASATTDFTKLNEYLKLLANCLADKATIKDLQIGK